MATTTGDLAEDVVLDELSMLGESVHRVCCKRMPRWPVITTLCGLEMSPEDEVSTSWALTCAPCIEIDAELEGCPSQLCIWSRTS